MRISLYDYNLNGYVHSYSKKSLIVFLSLILINMSLFIVLVHVWKEIWVRLICEIIYNISVYIVCPAVLIWFNDNVKNYFLRCIFGPTGESSGG